MHESSMIARLVYPWWKEAAVRVCLAPETKRGASPKTVPARAMIPTRNENIDVKQYEYVYSQTHTCT